MFDIFRKLDLSFLGEGWENCYLTFRPAFIKELKELANLGTTGNSQETQKLVEAGVEFLKKKFVGGKALKNGKVVDVVKDDLDEFPVEILNAAFDLLAGEPSKKKEKPSGT